MSASTALMATDWLDVRERVADKLKRPGSSVQRSTYVAQAEELMRLGYIDVDAVMGELHPPTPPETFVAEAELPRFATHEEIQRHSEKQDCSWSDAWSHFEDQGYDMSQASGQYI
jgi:hypothetical protein